MCDGYNDKKAEHKLINLFSLLHYFWFIHFNNKCNLLKLVEEWLFKYLSFDYICF